MNGEKHPSSSGRILALDYGKIHTGAALSDPTGSIVRPLAAINEAAGPVGLKKIAALVETEGALTVVVGLPVSLNGERGAQANETAEFIAALRRALPVPVEAWDERFTSKLAAAKGRYSQSNPHSLAACCLLEDYLGSAEFRRRKHRR